MSKSKHAYTYGYWRTDKEMEAGFSHELISSDTAICLTADGKTDLDTLEGLAVPGVDTVLGALKNQVKIGPTRPYLGTRVGDAYQWMSFQEVDQYADDLSYGFMALGLIPVVDHDGMEWRFMGIQSKNRKEWNLTHFANMYQKTTTVALYDTLGPEATKFIVDQTQLTTISCTSDCVEKLAKLKKEDEEGLMKTLKNLITFDDYTPEQKTLCDECSINIYHIDLVLSKGKAFKESEKGSKTLPGPDDVFMFSYTSGTTGNPKGVQLTHKMILSCSYAVNTRVT